MPIFLIEYDRSRGELVTLRKFERRDDADEERLRLEISLNRQGLKREVVILDASSEQALRATHRRYFEQLSNLASSTEAPSREG